MVEATANARTKDALHRAHIERGMALRWLVKAMVRGLPTGLKFPLSGTALTGSPR
ncbi:hypothetical protein [Thalassovita sp.]|uniref:hypothetical protein n=1 Tax=Thalassovita sp. TaxID=1979401 RepID=UPI002882B71A|nr:hypothetical protein [Thalassovita sp.]MDF1803259.1 hypothetical protein [Thalassovita sp.]